MTGAPRRNKTFYKTNQLNNSYSHEVKPLLKVYQCLGRFPYDITASGIPAFRPWSVPVMYTIIYYAFTGVFALMICKELINEKLLKAENIDDAIISMEILIFEAQHVFGPLVYWIGSRNYLKYYRSWDLFQRVVRLDNNSATKKIIKYYTVILVPLVCILAFVCAHLVVGLPVYLSVTFIPIVLSLITDGMLWFITLYKIRQQTKALVSKIYLNGLKHDLEECRINWLCLSQLTTDLGASYPLVHFINLLTVFICFVLSAFGFCYNLLFNPTGPIINWTHLLTIFWLIFSQYIACQATYETTRIVGKDFSGHLSAMDLSKLSNKLMNQVLCFLRTVSSNSPKVILAGVIILDKTLLITFYSKVINYLVVLLQFAASSTSKKFFITQAVGRNHSN